MNSSFRTILLCPCILLAHLVSAQYILNGSAKQNTCNCYTLTTNTTFNSGSVWNKNKINLTDPFDFWFKVNLGCNDNGGADGIAFILQPLSTSVGSAGSGLGFEGVKPSVGITLDTYQNFENNDPPNDHISIQANGNLNHGNDLAGPVDISATNANVEDCQWHRLRISWDPTTHWLRAYFDTVLRVEKQVDLVATIFGNDPNVYWGFTGSTGGAINLQQFCTALDPIIASPDPTSAFCEGKAVTFISQSESFAPIKQYNWDFGDGKTAIGETPAAHQYPGPGNYPVKLTVTGQDGCSTDTIKTVTIGSIPNAQLSVTDACEKQLPELSTSQTMFAVSYNWTLDGTSLPVGNTPALKNLSVGPHQLDLVVKSLNDCGPDKFAKSNFQIKPLPDVRASRIEQCGDISLEGEQLDANTQIDEWKWSFSDGGNVTGQVVQHHFAGAGPYDINLWATASNGCTSDTITSTVTIPVALVSAGRDTVIVMNQPFQLQGAGNGKFSWEPATLVSDPSIATPEIHASANQKYVLTVATDGGCTASDTVNIKVFEGPAIYIPNAFSPNGDRLNDVLRPLYVGIKSLKQFKVFNRWGEVVFTTSKLSVGWDGTYGGQPAAAGTYIWFLEATNQGNQTVTMKGYVTIIR